MDENDRNQLQLLAVFHYVLAGLGGLVSLLPTFHILMGAAIVSGRFPDGGNEGMPSSFGWVFIAMGAFLMLMGFGYAALVAVAGRFLARRRHWTFCMVVAALSCAFFPLGTALGVFTILVLARPEVKAAFQAADAALPTAPYKG